MLECLPGSGQLQDSLEWRAAERWGGSVPQGIGKEGDEREPECARCDVLWRGGQARRAFSSTGNERRRQRERDRNKNRNSKRVRDRDRQRVTDRDRDERVCPTRIVERANEMRVRNSKPLAHSRTWAILSTSTTPKIHPRDPAWQKERKPLLHWYSSRTPALATRAHRLRQNMIRRRAVRHAGRRRGPPQSSGRL